MLEHDPLCPYFHDTEWTLWMVNEGPSIRWAHEMLNFSEDDKDACPWCAFVKMIRDDERSKS